MPEPSFRRASARRLLSITACVAAVAGLSLTAVSASAAEPTTAIPHSKPAWVAKAAKSGTPATTATTSLRVYLAPKGGIDALKADALAVSTPGSATYRHFITPAQYRARYAPSTATVQSVETYLRSAGLTVTGVEASNRWISLTGDVATAQKAFHTTIGRFKHNGRTVQAPAAALSLPSSIASLVSTVTGLDTTPRLVKPTAATPVPPGAGFRNARPCSIDYGQVAAKYKADFKTPLPKFQGKTIPYSPCGYTGPQLRAAYEGSTTLDGSGVTVAITDAYASPTIAADANTYASNHGDGGYAGGQLTQVTPAAKKYTDTDTLRRVRLVRRGDARRRGRARHGSGCEHPLLRRDELQRQRPPDRAGERRGRQQGEPRLQLVGRRRGGRVGRLDQRVRAGVPPGHHAGHLLPVQLR